MANMSKAVVARDYQETINSILNMRSENISIYDKAKVFDEVLFKIQASHIEDQKDNTKGKKNQIKSGKRKNNSMVDDISLYTLEGLI